MFKPLDILPLKKHFFAIVFSLYFAVGIEKNLPKAKAGVTWQDIGGRDDPRSPFFWDANVRSPPSKVMISQISSMICSIKGDDRKYSIPIWYHHHMFIIFSQPMKMARNLKGWSAQFETSWNGYCWLYLVHYTSITVYHQVSYSHPFG